MNQIKTILNQARKFLIKSGFLENFIYLIIITKFLSL